MQWFEIAALLTVVAAVASWANDRFLGLPTTIGLTLISMLASLAIVASGTIWPEPLAELRSFVATIDFDEALLGGMLGFLLFAGSLHIELDDLRDQAGTIAFLATAGLLLSTCLVGVLAYQMLHWLGYPVAFVHCLIFGAIVSPTDPIAVIAILGSLGAPRSLETKIAGESLFNDGFAVVIFLVLLRVAGLDSGHGDAHAATQAITGTDVGLLLLQETGGAVVFGLAIGAIAYRMLRSVDNYSVEVLISLALVSGGYVGAQALHLSGPIAMVVAGLLIGNHGRSFAMSDKTREHLDTFWELVDEILNAILFVLVGLEVLAVSFAWGTVTASIGAIVIALLARTTAVYLPMGILRRFRSFTPNAEKIMVWGGLRGGISVALVLSLSGSLGRAEPEIYRIFVAMTYAVVAFSIIVQGLTVAPLLRRLGLASA